MIGHAKVKGGINLPGGDPRVTSEGEMVDILYESKTSVLVARYGWEPQGPVESYGVIAKADVISVERKKKQITDEDTWPQFLSR